MLDDLIEGAKGVVRESNGKLRERQVFHMVETGQLPVIRKGRKLYFRKAEIEAAFRSEAV